MNIEYSRRLNLDCKTRWNSTYIMLSIVVLYRDVFDRLSLRERLLIAVQQLLIGILPKR